jgi:hypothetical protein
VSWRLVTWLGLMCLAEMGAAAAPSSLVTCATDGELREPLADAVRSELPGTEVVTGDCGDADPSSATLDVRHAPGDRLDVVLVWKHGARRSATTFAAGGEVRRVAQWVATEMELPDPVPIPVQVPVPVPPAVAVAAPPHVDQAIVRLAAVASSSSSGGEGLELVAGLLLGGSLQARVVGEALLPRSSGAPHAETMGLELAYPTGLGPTTLELSGGALAGVVMGESWTRVQAGPELGVAVVVPVSGPWDAFAALRGARLWPVGAGEAEWQAQLGLGLGVRY